MAAVLEKLMYSSCRETSAHVPFQIVVKCTLRVKNNMSASQKRHRDLGENIMQEVVLQQNQRSLSAWLLLHYLRINYCLTLSFCHFPSLYKRQSFRLLGNKTHLDAGERKDKRIVLSVSYSFPFSLYLFLLNTDIDLWLFSLTSFRDQISSSWVLKPTSCLSGMAERYTNNLTW